MSSFLDQKVEDASDERLHSCDANTNLWVTDTCERRLCRDDQKWILVQPWHYPNSITIHDWQEGKRIHVAIGKSFLAAIGNAESRYCDSVQVSKTPNFVLDHEKRIKLALLHLEVFILSREELFFKLQSQLSTMDSVRMTPYKSGQISLMRHSGWLEL